MSPLRNCDDPTHFASRAVDVRPELRATYPISTAPVNSSTHSPLGDLAVVGASSSSSSSTSITSLSFPLPLPTSVLPESEPEPPRELPLATLVDDELDDNLSFDFVCIPGGGGGIRRASSEAVRPREALERAGAETGALGMEEKLSLGWY